MTDGEVMSFFGGIIIGVALSVFTVLIAEYLTYRDLQRRLKQEQEYQK